MTYKILLVDGDAARAAKRRAPLVEPGHEVAVALGAEEAVLAFDRSKPHLVVIDAAVREDAIRDLCGLLKKKAADVPIVLLTDVVGDPRQVALLLNQYGCDQLIDGSLAPERMLRVIEQLVGGGAKGAAPRAKPAAGDPGGTTLWLDSEELVNALEKLDTIITHTAAGQIHAPAPRATGPSGPPAEVLASVDARFDRDLPGRPATTGPDGGTDIDDHINSIFARGRASNSPPHAQAQPPVPQTGPVSPAEPVSPPRPPAPPREPVIVKATQAARQPAAPAPYTSTATPPLPQIKTMPAPIALDLPAPDPLGLTPQPRTDTSVVSVADTPHGPGSSVRWLIAATVVVTLLGAGYLLLFRGVPDATTPSVADAGSSPAEAPPFTPAADRPADGTSGVSKATVSVPVTAPAAAAPAKLPPPKPAPVPSSPPAATRPSPAAATHTQSSAPKVSTAKVTNTPAPVKRSVEPPPVPASRPVVRAPEPAPQKTTPAPPQATAPPKTPPRPTLAPVVGAFGASAVPPPVKREEEPPASSPPAVRASGFDSAVPTAAAPAPEPVAEKRETEPTRQPEPAPAAPAPALAVPTPAPAVAKAEPGPVVPPKLVTRVEPVYSPKALKGVSDPRVVLRVLVDNQGRITRVVVDKGIPGSELEAAAVSAVLRWKYEPARRDGTPIEAWTNAEFKFAP